MLVAGRLYLVAQAEIQCEFGRDPPVVLNINGEVFVAPLYPEERAEHAGSGRPQQRGRDTVAHRGASAVCIGSLGEVVVEDVSRECGVFKKNIQGLAT